MVYGKVVGFYLRNKTYMRNNTDLKKSKMKSNREIEFTKVIKLT